MPKIKFVFHVVGSKMDKAGNRYFFTTMTDTASGARVRFYGERDTDASIRRQLGLKWDESLEIRETIGKRDFMAIAKGLCYGMANDFITTMNAEKKKIALAIKNKIA